MGNWDNPSARGGGARLDFGHVGGTSTNGDIDSWYPELWDWLSNRFSVKTMFDVGCGCGFAMKFFSENKIVPHGIDCEQVLEHFILDKAYSSVHDLTTGPFYYAADLVWCCEVAEHIEEQFVDNIITTLAKSTQKVLALCAAPEGAGGYHHVLCRNPPYWINLLEKAGLSHRIDLTEEARALCPEAYGRSRNNYFRRSGLIFTKE